MLSKRKAMFRQKIGYVSIRNYYMIARNRTPFSTFQMKILTWKTKIHLITTFRTTYYDQWVNHVTRFSERWVLL